MPNYIVAPAPFPPEQFVNATDSTAAARKAGLFAARALEGNGESTFPVFVVQAAATTEQFDVTATATINRSVTVVPHTP